MAQPPGRRMRPAAHGALTGPHPHGPTATPNPVPEPGPRTSRAAGERQDARTRNHLAKLLVQESSRKRATGIGRWIEAKKVQIWVLCAVVKRRGHQALDLVCETGDSSYAEQEGEVLPGKRRLSGGGRLLADDLQ